MSARVFVHLGAPKSGTSYLQQILWGNKDRLAEHGVLLPGNRRAHYEAMGDLRRGLWHDPDAAWSWDRLAAAVTAHDGTAIISEEMLGAATPEQASSAVRRLAPAEVHLVVAERDLWRTIPSAWQQSVRARAVGSFGSFVEGLRTGRNPGFWDNQFAMPILRRWSALVPAERRHVVTVPAPGAPRTELWRRFCAVVGLDPDAYETGTPVGNPSLGAPEAELLRRVNVALDDEFPLSRPYLSVVRRHLTLPVLMRNAEPARFGAPLEAEEWVAAKAEEMVQELRDSGCHLVGDLDDLVPRDFAGSRSPDDYAADELLALAVESLVGMLRHTDEEVRRLEATVATLRARAGRLGRELDEARRPWYHGLRRRTAPPTTGGAA